MPSEVAAGLSCRPGDIFLDATIDGGGHALYLVSLCPSLRVIGIDLDSSQLAAASERLKAAGADFVLRKANFRNLPDVLDEISIGLVNRVLFDLGLSSWELEESGRGFSFLRDEPLVMTYADQPQESDLTASEVINSWKEEVLRDIFYAYGDERYARLIAQAIAKARRDKPIRTTIELVKIIESAVPISYRRSRIHCATRTFQAIRIVVNDEIESLRLGLSAALLRLAEHGRIAVISFESITGRVVKEIFKSWCKQKIARLVDGDVLRPTRAEVRSNPRSRSAQLRIIEKF